MSYYVAYKHPGLGQRKSSNFALESDALAYRAGQPQEWPGGVVYTPEPPDIFRHCGPADDARNPSQAVGGKCFWCGKVLTRADAREHARPVK